MSLQPNELLIILLVAVIVLGPKRLPAAIRGIGRVFRQVRDFSASVRQEMEATINPPKVEPAAAPNRKAHDEAQHEAQQGAAPEAEPSAGDARADDGAA